MKKRNCSFVPNPSSISECKSEVRKKRSVVSYTNTILFVGLIFGFSIASMVGPKKMFSETENRVLQQKPEFTLETLFDGSFIQTYEKYVTDQFVLRDQWIGLKTYAELALQKKDINGVYFGKDGYLIEKVEDSDLDLEQMEKNTNRLVEFITKYEKVLGKDHVFAMIAPTAFEILSEKLPPYATGFDQGAYLDQLKQKLSDNFIDLRDVLNQHDKEYIYYRTDHHWTVLGAYYAYTEWAKASGIEPMSKEEFEIKEVSDTFLGTLHSKVNLDLQPDKMEVYDSKHPFSVIYNMDGQVKHSLYDYNHLKTKDQYAFYLNGNNPFVEITSRKNNGKKLLIIKDSYANCFAPFAANEFETVYMVDLRYMNMPVSQLISTYGITDILVLYNVNSFVKDKNLLTLVR